MSDSANGILGTSEPKLNSRCKVHTYVHGCALGTLQEILGSCRNLIKFHNLLVGLLQHMNFIILSTSTQLQVILNACMY